MLVAGFFRWCWSWQLWSLCCEAVSSGLPHTIEISRTLDGTGIDLLFGVPASEERTTSHWPSAENVGSGLRGVVDGLNDAQARPGAVSGVALYPHWELDEAEWALYETLWLGY